MMNLDSFRQYCLAKPGVTEELPFDDETLVYKVMGKLFALSDIKEPFSINLKCDPAKAIELRASYPSVQPGYHMNKQHWNTIFVDGTMDDAELKIWIDHSYELVVQKLPRKDKASLKGL
jgi:predicted DNA-binding protein (MmcQ/YjbR family)